MELETEDQINIDYNIFFYATVCHVCKRFSVALWRCGGCRMISYCGKEHLKQHWAQHESLCKAIQDALRDGLESTPPDAWYNRKLSLIEAVAQKKGFLELYEMQMFLFPRDCAVCHEEDLQKLVVCRKCAISFCKDHIDDIAHRSACKALGLSFRSSLSAVKHNLCQYFDPRRINWVLNNSGTKIHKFQNMADFVHTFWNKESIEEAHLELYTILEANVSEFLTRPLTLFCAMQLLNYVPECKELVIHIVDAGVAESIPGEAWEFLLHLIKDNEVSLVVIMIGTRLKFKSHSLSVCDDCLSQGKKVSFEFHSILYEDYVRSPSFVKPDFIAGFNVGVGFYIPGNEYQYVTEMTELCIETLAKQNCPLLLTCKEKEELEIVRNNLNAIPNRTVDCLHSGKNPFASLRPFRWPERLIVYNNNFMVIYRSLGS